MTLSLSSAHLTPQHHPFVTRHHQLRQNNPHPCPKRLQLLRQILASIEYGLKRAVEVAVVVLVKLGITGKIRIKNRTSVGK